MMRIPRQVVIEVSSKCNLRCIGCPINTDESGGGFMSFSFFKSIIDRIDFPTTVVPWLNGEPLLNPEYGKMIDYLISRKQRFYTTTNGHYWRADFFERVMQPDSTCYQIIFSLDGLPTDNSRSIELARPGSIRRKVLSTIYSALDLKKKMQSNIDIAVKICERGQDYEEFENYISYWLYQGVDYVCVGKMLENENVSRGFRIYPCRYFNDMAMEIRWDGRVVPCSYHDKVMNFGALPMGILDEKVNLLDFYNNEAYSKLREQHADGDFPAPCDTCGFAYTGDGFLGEVTFKNKALGDRTIYWHQDYYNSFYSFKKKREGISWK
jgi:MoaA/NifB/PqqE/SkfB family radical SAM enzyme